MLLSDGEEITSLEDCPDGGHPWPCYRGGLTQTGRADTSLIELEKDPLVRFGAPLSSPKTSRTRPTPGVAVTETTVFATAKDVYEPPLAVDRLDGDLLWRLDEVLENDVREREFDRTPNPLVICNSVFLNTSWRLNRLHTRSGQVEWWKGDVARNSPPTGNQHEMYNADTVCRIDPETGSLRGCERFRERGIFEGLARGGRHAVVSVRTDGGHAGLVAGYDVDDWSVSWTRSLERPIWEAPAVHDGRAFVLTDASRDAISGAGGEAVAYDLESGAERWRTELPEARGCPAHDEDETLYFSHERDVLVGIDDDDGSRVWSADVDEDLEALVGDPAAVYPPIVADDAVVLGGRDGLVVVDRADGSLRWDADWTLQGAPAVAFGDVYAITDEAIVAVRGA